MLEPFRNLLDDGEIQLEYFQQDVTTAHTTPVNLSYLQEFHVKSVISKKQSFLHRPLI